MKPLFVSCVNSKETLWSSQIVCNATFLVHKTEISLWSHVFSMALVNLFTKDKKMTHQVYENGLLQYEFDSGNALQNRQDAIDYITGCGIEWCIKLKSEETDRWSKQVLELQHRRNIARMIKCKALSTI